MASISQLNIDGVMTDLHDSRVFSDNFRAGEHVGISFNLYNILNRNVPNMGFYALIIYR